jgi:ribonuclease D
LLLNEFCKTLAKGPYLTIDTEFLRDKTYYPKLCLIQMSAPGVDACAIDPVEFKFDMTPFNELMANTKVLKVFHAARQDLEIFFQMCGVLPQPIFDTQVAAMVAGFGDQIAYNALVKETTGHALEKNAQFTDWSRRPLSNKQIKYALDDVLYLRDVYETLEKRLRDQGREDWADQEMGILTNPRTYTFLPEDAWERIKIRSDKPEVLAILKELAAWRESEAQRKDVPRGRILKDETIADLALYRPKDEEGLSRIRSLSKDMIKGDKAAKILSLIAKARADAPENWPQRPFGAAFPRQAQGLLEMLKMLLRICSAEADVTARIVASSEDLEILAVEDNPDIPVLQGWRYDVFGKEAIALKEGKLGLTVKNGKIIRLPL